MAIFYHQAYRLPVSSLHADRGIDLRRADEVISYLLDEKLVAPGMVRPPAPVGYDELRLVHGDALLEALRDPTVVGDLFAMSGAPVDEIMRTVRLACGGTVEAARHALARRGAVVNLLGGFHHAAPDRAGPLCPVNDIAVAVAVARRDGFSGRVVVIDLDAHPPDGTAACFAGDPDVWIGSLSGSDWGPLPGVDETFLEGADDARYLAALEGLLERMPRPDLAFVIAGGDVLAGDRMGKLGLSLEGARLRDRRVAEALGSTPAVWLPGGGYHRHGWKVLAGTVMVVARRSLAPVEERDPLHRRFTRIRASLTPDELGDSDELTMADLFADLGAPHGAVRLLGFYSADGIEHALARYGILAELRRLGFDQFRVVVDRSEGRDRARLFGSADGREHLLVECMLSRQRVEGREVLFVEWLTMQDPRRTVDPTHALPGQSHPGLGLAREMGELFVQLATRLGLAGVAFRPAWLHTAHAARHHCRFVDSARQGRFEALIRDTRDRPLSEVTVAADQGRIDMNGEPYRWEPDLMLQWLDRGWDDDEAVRAERERVRFQLRAAAA